MLYIVTPGDASTVDAEGDNFVFWFSRTQKMHS